ncbi:MAG: hypothetical protein ACR2L8_10760 [Solirubrobacteraceae bacterium]
MPSSPRPLWSGYDDADEDDLLALLDGTDRAADDPDDPTVEKAVSGGLAHAIAKHESIKQELDPDNYRPRLHARASEIAGSWRP